MPIVHSSTTTSQPQRSFGGRNRWSVWYYRHRWVLWGIVSFTLIIGVGSMLLLRPLMQRVKQDRQTIDETQETLRVLEQDVSQMEHLISQYRTLVTEKSGEIDRIFEALPSTPRQSELFGTLETLVGTHGGSLASIKIDKVKPVQQAPLTATPGSVQEPVSPLEQSEKINGIQVIRSTISIGLPPEAYDTVKSLLSGFETSTRFMDITSMGYQGSGPSDGGSIPITLQTYYLPE